MPCLAGGLTNITDFDPATGRTTTTLVAEHDRGSMEFNQRVGGAPGANVTSIIPNTAVVGGPDVTLRVIGTNFEPGDVILFNGGPEPTTFVSSTELTTIVEPSTASGPATVPVTVVGATGSADFTFTPEVP